MELSGSLDDNLRFALQSAKRFRGHPVHADTLQFWSGLLQLARRARTERDPSELAKLDALIRDLGNELAER